MHWGWGVYPGGNPRAALCGITLSSKCGSMVGGGLPGRNIIFRLMEAVGFFGDDSGKGKDTRTVVDDLSSNQDLVNVESASVVTLEPYTLTVKEYR